MNRRFIKSLVKQRVLEKSQGTAYEGWENCTKFNVTAIPVYHSLCLWLGYLDYPILVGGGKKTPCLSTDWQQIWLPKLACIYLMACTFQKYMFNAKNRNLKMLTSAIIDSSHEKLSNLPCFNKISWKITVSHLKCKVPFWFCRRMPLDLNAKNFVEFDHFLAIFGDRQFELFCENFQTSPTKSHPLPTSN